MFGLLGVSFIVGFTVLRMVVVASGWRMMILKFPSFFEIVAFAGHTGKGDSHQQQGE